MVAVELEIQEDRDCQPKIPTRRFPLVHVFNGIVYEAHKVTRDNRQTLRNRALIFENEFGYGNSFLTHEKVTRFVREGGEVVFAKTPDKHPKDIGVVTQEMRKATVAGRTVRVLSIGMRVVLPEFQKHRVGTHLADDGIIRHRPDAVTGQSRTWRIFRMYEEMGLVSKIHPISAPMTPEIQEALKGGVLDKSTLAVTDLRTGLCLGVLPPADIKRFIPPDSNTKGMEIYKKIRSIGARPERGDAIRYWIDIDQKAVEVAIQAGWDTPETMTPRRLVLPPFARRLVTAVFGLRDRFVR